MELSMKTQTLLFGTGKLRVVSQPCSSKIRTIQEVSQSVSGISIMRNSIVLKGLLAAAAAAVPLLCHAESNVQTGASTAAPGATAHVDFQITIPKILYLRVGTGSSYTTGVLSSVGTVDLVSFAPTAAQVGNGTAVAGTGGDQTNGVETAAVVSNSGNVTLNATATGALGDGAGDSIAYTQITTTATTLTSATALPAPTL